MNYRHFTTVVVSTFVGMVLLGGPAQAAQQNNSVEILRQALFGAGVGAISAEVSGGKAGKGAWIGAGANVLGQALLGLLTTPSHSSYGYQQPVYQQQPAYQQPVYQQPVYTPPVYRPATKPVRHVQYYNYDVQPVYVQQQPVYTPSYYSYEDPNKRILKQGLMGAGVGALSAEVSGGKAGTGALVGAGTNVIGGALLELLTSN